MKKNKDSHILISPIGIVEKTHTLSPQQLIQDRTEKQILYSMDEDTYEELVTSWASGCLNGKYDEAYKIGGTGDHGIDILAKYTAKKEYDIYQCKHYNAPIEVV